MTWGEALGYLAAFVWFASAAFIRLPSNIWFVARVGGGGPNKEFETLVWRLRLMSRLNAAAAFLTAASVFCLVRNY
jgi:hypothetical protein